MSFFGGDPNLAHWSVTLTYKSKEPYKQRKERMRKEGEQVKAAGYKSQTFFEFRAKDLQAKAVKKKEAEALAKKIKAETGVDMEVNEGCFL